MRFAIALLAVLAVAASARPMLQEENYQFLFSKFVAQYSKAYEADQMFHRYSIFKENMDKILAWNAGNHTSTMGVNEFTDLTSAEFKQMANGFRPRAPINTNVAIRKPRDGGSLDWRDKNAVTPVKNQGQCGSCWAFSTTGSVEGANAISTGNLVSLSEQQLVDCAGSAGNQGCNGGLMDYAFQWIISNNGICTESDYPYTGEDGVCQQSCQPAATISSFQDVTSGDEDALMQAVNNGPVSIAIEADQAVFQMYSGGILSDPSCGTQLDHGVLVVGFGTDAGVDYWIVKNSWGQSWGEDGYIRMIRGQNECGLALAASYPIV